MIKKPTFDIKLEEHGDALTFGHVAISEQFLHLSI